MPHFRTASLRAAGGWDAWNVTEDADLGLRLARFGHRIDVLDTTTSEEAPRRLGVWMKQRRRWTKGWMQVALVLARDPRAWRQFGPARGVIVALLLVNLVVGPLATPLVLLLGARQVWTGGFDIGSMAIASLLPITAAASTLWCGVAGARARRLGGLAAWVPLLLPHQLLVAAAAWGGLGDLLCDPHGWRKTPHGAASLSRSSPAAPPRRQTESRRSPQGSAPRAQGRA